MSALPTPTREEILEGLEAIAQNGIPTEGLAWLTDVGSEQFLLFFEREILSGVVAHGGSTCRIFEAVYGEGKTHLLDLLRSRALHLGMAVVKADLSHTVSLHDWKLLTEHLLENVSMRVRGQTIRSLPRVLEELGRELPRPPSTA